ncbi:hypothetical protein P171DRAFT_476997 [Karstenula rhodostoma CBS 690.94]|uniref:Uncharacterized protein n=1 Tax=Karstenula rhodostoma CBS 690.94 TaxID=1392251 RepID=A0A9P4P8L3_9PLEO|nr:hypothetical protein P171DRAFT_476997 [Karstenula rhodostoma CBS 690.94]
MGLEKCVAAVLPSLGISCLGCNVWARRPSVAAKTLPLDGMDKRCNMLKVLTLAAGSGVVAGPEVAATAADEGAVAVVFLEVLDPAWLSYQLRYRAERRGVAAHFEQVLLAKMKEQGTSVASILKTCTQTRHTKQILHLGVRQAVEIVKMSGAGGQLLWRRSGCVGGSGATGGGSVGGVGDGNSGMVL